jgi:hypothetical protein
LGFRKLANPMFLIAAGVLAGGSAFVYGWVSAFGLHLVKEAVPLQAALENFPDEIAVGDETYVCVEKRDIEKETLEFLFDGGMGADEDYLQWLLVPLSEARAKLKEKQDLLRRKPDLASGWETFLAADLDNPVVVREECAKGVRSHPELQEARHLVNLFVTYYTGKADTVPHVPERCNLGAGRQIANERMVKVPCEGLQWGARGDFDVKVLDFVGRIEDRYGRRIELRSTEAYYFVANWQYMDSKLGLDLRLGVRLALADPRRKRVFFTKVQAAFPNLGQVTVDPVVGSGTAGPDTAEIESDLKAFLQAVAPIYEALLLPPPEGQAVAEDGPAAGAG